jgi:hypothetical protein
MEYLHGPQTNDALELLCGSRITSCMILPGIETYSVIIIHDSDSDGIY